MDIFFNITTELYHDKFSKVSFSVESENLSVNFFSVILIHLVHGPMPDFVTSFVDHLANTSALVSPMPVRSCLRYCMLGFGIR